ncbi:uncharacterized protein LOC131858254 [Cryptomeria japonica]|uniref:uncharacterized protein LOC131858254 n=1 Tax=Cryptomeria japonica TaxID=3369 RepID=UPI0027D9E02D|nr:uncharacterized protein LOC131858254 [Cryptomeria japonica]
MVQALKKCQHYLLPKEFIVYTDNHALSFLNGRKKPSHKHMKWVERLQAYTFTIKHKKGKTIKVADALIRRVCMVQEAQLQSVGIDSLKQLYKDDEDFSEIYEVVENVGKDVPEQAKVSLDQEQNNEEDVHNDNDNDGQTLIIEGNIGGEENVTQPKSGITN